jgi:hypothetical protein
MSRPLIALPRCCTTTLKFTVWFEFGFLIPYLLRIVHCSFHITEQCTSLIKQNEMPTAQFKRQMSLGGLSGGAIAPQLCSKKSSVCYFVRPPLRSHPTSSVKKTTLLGGQARGPSTFVFSSSSPERILSVVHTDSCVAYRESCQALRSLRLPVFIGCGSHLVAPRHRGICQSSTRLCRPGA